MNGRIKLEDTPEGRLAAVVESKNRQVRHRYEKISAGPIVPDYRDYTNTLRPWYRREELIARLDTAKQLRQMSAAEIESFISRLAAELNEVVSQLPSEYNL